MSQNKEKCQVRIEPNQTKFATSQDNRGKDRVHAYLTQMARQSGIAEASFCDDVFGRFDKSAQIRAALMRELNILKLNETKFYALTILYSMDPEPISNTDLAYHVDRKSIGINLVQLASMRLIRLRSSDVQKSKSIELTDEGRHHTAFAIYRYLQAVSRLCNDEDAVN